MAELESRITDLERITKEHAQDIGGHDTALDHVMKTLDTIVLPTQERHTEDLLECKQRTQASHDYITAQNGVGAWLKQAAMLIGAAAAITSLAIKLAGK